MNKYEALPWLDCQGMLPPTKNLDVKNLPSGLAETLRPPDPVQMNFSRLALCLSDCTHYALWIQYLHVFAWWRHKEFTSHHALCLSSRYQYQLSQKLCVWSLLLPSFAKSRSQKNPQHADTAGKGWENNPPRVGGQQQKQCRAVPIFMNHDIYR